MVCRIYAVFSILLLQSYADATEKNTEKFEDLTTSSIILDDIDKTQVTIKVIENKEGGNSQKGDQSQGQREKREFNYESGYYQPGFPVYQNYAPQYIPSTNEQALVQINNKLHKILTVARQSAVPQAPLSPVYPVILPPLFPYRNNNCKCTPAKDYLPPLQPELTDHRPLTPPSEQTGTTQKRNNTVPTVEVGSRLPEIANDIDNIRPISLKPIPPMNVLKRPSPSVDRGSVQADNTSNNRVEAPIIVSDVVTRSPDNWNPEYPSLCDSAILRCCQLPLVNRNCFTSQGCENPLIYGKPCDPKVISVVLERFQTFYAQKNR